MEQPSPRPQEQAAERDSGQTDQVVPAGFSWFHVILCGFVWK